MTSSLIIITSFRYGISEVQSTSFSGTSIEVTQQSNPSALTTFTSRDARICYTLKLVASTHTIPSQGTRKKMSLDEETQTRLKTIATSMALALNSRDFSPTSPAWSHLSPSFLAGPLPPLINSKIGVSEYLKHLSDMCAQHPDWKLRVVDSDVQSQVTNLDKASVFTNVENQGLPQGVVWQSVGISDFERGEGGEWVVVGYRGFAGGHGVGELF